MAIQNEAAIRDILGIDEDFDLKGNEALDDFDWDSLAIVVLQTFIDDEYNEEVDPDSLTEFTTLVDLDKFISSFSVRN